MQSYDAIVLGAGASGLMCAATAAKAGVRVLLLEHNAKAGRKILASGGGNCNFTNWDMRAQHFVSQNPHFTKSALSRFTPQHFVELLSKHQVSFQEKKEGQLFCTQGAEKILQVLLAECRSRGVEMQTGITVQKVLRKEGGFLLIAGEQSFLVPRLVVATGGLSYRGLGASDFGLRIGVQFGHHRVPTAPALVPFLLGGYASLAGVSLPVGVTVGKRSLQEDLLFTHKGLSGPALLQASLWWQEGERLKVDFLPGQELAELIQIARQEGQKSLPKLLSKHLPSRMVEFWLDREVSLAPKDLPNLSNQEIAELTKAFQAWEFLPQGTEGYKTAEVTRGGMDTKELSSKTMESNKVPGLYFIGEVVDVTGMLGGYNLHWAWASGHAAGVALAEALEVRPQS